MPIGDDHRKEDGLHLWVVVGHLVGHVFEGAVGEGAFAFVYNLTEIPDEVLLGCELAEHPLRLREVQASYGPADQDLALVFIIYQPLGKDLGELLHVVHQDPRWGLLQGDGL